MEQPHDLEELLDRICEADQEQEEGGKVSVGDILDAVGHRSFGALLLAAGIFTVVPGPADIPGVPTLVAILVLLVAAQLLLRRDHIWLPDWILRRDVSRDKLEKALGWARKPARFIDRAIRPRLHLLVRGVGAYAIAGGCILIALALPPMELVPFSANLAGAALSAYALALIARDGLLALVAHAVTIGAVVLVLVNLL